MSTTSKVTLIANICLILLGFSTFAWGVNITKKNIWIKETYQKTTGTVYDIKTEYNYGAEVAAAMDYLQIEFGLPSGEIIKFTNDYNRENIKHKIGDVLPIYYNPANPKDAYVADYRFLFTTAGVLILMGGVLIIYPGQYVIKYFFDKKNNTQNKKRP
ncbi:MAG: hypothetical protein UR53_C0002G0072 [Candidatus Magasanikbacteria bacterium GW2011_GWC2_34_16]|uniref:DUF3592 domain-containing protein n=2 Tax=Candidatus Magasanikiibacteriota TaxID=1752731 RepID=A0A0G0HBY4_9BACT|nr:MAG: hypothetical protein UR53_C0002G0072 [Candidatus Magasanikbacteria bacterium GW2011_GWC2_34_16]KKQ40718.1 MAG: hypothetical protein US58_C0013G0018 [Candidatus Magasanikbacteria bacterium GW2011_GWA2_37_8]